MRGREGVTGREGDGERHLYKSTIGADVTHVDTESALSQ